MHRVAIVGGGFGGLYAAKPLRKAPADRPPQFPLVPTARILAELARPS